LMSSLKPDVDFVFSRTQSSSWSYGADAFVAESPPAAEETELQFAAAKPPPAPPSSLIASG
jgi:hypothetical protein